MISLRTHCVLGDFVILNPHPFEVFIASVKDVHGANCWPANNLNAKGDRIMAFCGKCGAALNEGATFCGSCGSAVGAVGAAPAQPPAAVSGSASSGLAPNVAGALAYVTLIPPILFLVMEPYNKDKFIRFHAFQSIFFHVSAIVLMIAFMLVGFILGLIPVIGWIIDILLWIVLGFGLFGLWIYLVYKAYQGEQYMLPVVGKLAAQQAG